MAISAKALKIIADAYWANARKTGRLVGPPACPYHPDKSKTAQDNDFSAWGDPQNNWEDERTGGEGAL